MIDSAGAGRSAGALGIAPSVLLALLPKLTCPLCWPAYGAALSALGLGFVDYTPYLLPLTALFIAVSLGALAWTARVRGDWLPVGLGALGAANLLLGRFALESDILTYAAIALLVVAPFASQRRRPEAACPNCVPTSAEEVRP
jgi:hypothetical protein